MGTGISDFLKGGNKSASFLTVGTSYTGTVVSAEPVQRRDIKTGELLTWDDGKPMMQIVVTIQTDLRDPEVEHDDGRRGVYIKAWGEQLKALKRAIREAGDDDIREGGTFTATYVGDGEKTNKAFDAPKIFAYEYKKPSGAASLLKALEPQVAAAPAPAPVAPAEVDPAYAAFLAYQASQAA